MYDGFGLDYFEKSNIPTMKYMAQRGFFKEVKAVMPSVTNTNNVSICCGAWPNEHGITGNSYFNEVTGREDYMEDEKFLCIPTILQRLAWENIKSALLTCKRKTVHLLSRGAEISIAAEDPPVDYVNRFGAPPDIYSKEINFWLWKVALDILKYRSDIRFLYIHTTDYPMHMWSPEERESMEHLVVLDSLLDEARHIARDAVFLITADHGLNYKKRCWDLTKACKKRGVEIKYSLSVEKDRYVKHHRTFGGTAWVWLKSPKDESRVANIIGELEGVEIVMTRREAARRFNLMAERIGELVVLGDRDTVFGELSTDMEILEPTYRSHGSLYELDVPLIIYNHSWELPPSEFFTNNLHLTRSLFNR
jgi:phosphonoacetate hydrolase